MSDLDRHLGPYNLRVAEEFSDQRFEFGSFSDGFPIQDIPADDADFHLD